MDRVMRNKYVPKKITLNLTAIIREFREISTSYFLISCIFSLWFPPASYIHFIPEEFVIITYIIFQIILNYSFYYKVRKSNKLWKKMKI